MALKNIIEPLQNWNFIEIEKRGTSNIVSLSEDRKKSLKKSTSLKQISFIINLKIILCYKSTLQILFRM